MVNDTNLTERENKIYIQYQEVIAPLIAVLEVRDGNYPIEIFNEIRAIFTHLSRFKIQSSEQDLISAERHVKRAILDCYKYMCVSIKEQMVRFREEYRNVDLGIADNGMFLVTLNRLQKEADESFVSAKKKELVGEISEEELFGLFETAYIKQKDLEDYLENSEEAILFASSHSHKRDRITMISITVTVISILFAIIGFLH